MTSGWIALLDDLATLTKVAAASLDDAGAQAAKAGSKAAGIVIDDAAVTLGATRLQAFFKVVLPNIRAGVAAAFVLAFITSFNQVPVSLFLTGPGVSTLPIEMMAYMETSYDPSIAALSTLLVVFTIVLVALTEKVLGISKYV